MSTLTPKKIIALVRRAPSSFPMLDEADLISFDVIEKKHGAYAEAYIGHAFDLRRHAIVPGVTCFTFDRVDGRWMQASSSSYRATSASQAHLARALARAKRDQALHRPTPVRVVLVKSSPPKPAMGERAGVGKLVETPIEGRARLAKPAHVARIEKKLGSRFPAGYRTYVTSLGRGTYGTRVHVRLPDEVAKQLSVWRSRIEQYWFWGEAPLPQSRALEGIRIADTTDGDELLFHPDDPDAIWMLPRHGRKARLLGRGLAAALGKIVRSTAPVLHAR